MIAEPSGSQKDNVPDSPDGQSRFKNKKRPVSAFQIYRRHRVLFWIVAILLISVAAAGIYFLRPAYRYIRSERLLAMAEKFAQEEDHASASLTYRKAILSGNTRPIVWKKVGVYLEKIGSPDIVHVHKNLSSLEPDVMEHRFRHAEELLKQRRIAEAKDVLDRLPDDQKDTEIYHQLAGEAALITKDFDAASGHYQRLTEIAPENEEHRFRLLLAQMYLPDPLVAYPAKEQIRTIADQGGEMGQKAYRELIARSAMEGDVFDASRLAGRLVELPNPTFDDMALYLNLEIASQSFTLPVALQRFLDFGRDNPEEIPQVATFLFERGQTERVRTWMESLSPEILELPDVQGTRFQLALSNKDWKEAFRFLVENRLPIKIPPANIDLVAAAFDQYDAGSPEANQTWQRVITELQTNPGALQLLSIFAEARGWTLANGRALNALVRVTGNNPQIVRRLAKFEGANRNLAGYQYALTLLRKADPSDQAVASDWIFTSVLLRREAPETILNVAEKLLADTGDKNPTAVTAYAIALLNQNHVDEAAAAIEKLSTRDRFAPERAVYVGAVLAAQGKKDEALEFLFRAENVSTPRFAEEAFFRRLWVGIANGEPTAKEQLDKILADLAAWKYGSEEDVAAVLAATQPYDVGSSARILEDLRREVEIRKQNPIQIGELLQENDQPNPNPSDSQE